MAVKVSPPSAAPVLTPLAQRCSDLEIDRLDLVARLLACKQPEPDPEGLLARAAGVLAGRRGGPWLGDAEMIAAITALIRVSAEVPRSEAAARERVAAQRLSALLAAPLEPAELSALRGLVRHGELAGPLSVAAQRRLRQLCQRLPADGEPAAQLPGTAGAWESLLELLARSVLTEPAAEIAAAMALDCPDPESLQRRRAAVRAALERGAGEPIAPRPLATDTVFVDEVQTLSGLPDLPPPERALLVSGHKIGRFTLLTRLGVGAMGVVYSAYDPELDRKIAVKLLRAPEGLHTARAQARLLREAQAMARINHPNVAQVHDVGTQGRDVFVAMEFIRGHTLQAWKALRPRSWSEVLEVYVQAGRGLAAAHMAGLVHRDFKPSNAMIGADGRVRVLDFGLCHSHAAAEPVGDDMASSESAVTDRQQLSADDEIVGTPAYMAPEQFHGRSIGAASDQFSFCAALYEALYDQLPFAGDDVYRLAHAVACNELRPPPRASRVPVWLHAALVRGMKPDPRARFSTMDALLRALDRGRVRVRSGIMAAAGALLVAGGLGFWTASTGHRDDPCSGGAAAIAAVWSEPEKEEVARAFTVAGPALAAETWPRVEAGLGAYADDWQKMHRASCEAHRRGENSAEMLDRRMACLAGRRTALAEATRVLGEADLAVARRALAVVGDLPPIDRCGDVAALMAAVPPPADPQLRAAVEEQRPRLVRVRSLEQAGRGAAALVLADEVVTAASRLGDRALLAESLLQRAYLEIHAAASPPAQVARLTQAYLTALGGGLDELVAEALALRLYARGRTEGETARALEDLAVAREAVTRLPAPGRLRGLVLNNAGAVYMGLEDAAQAESMFRAALAAREGALGHEHVEVAFTLVNLAMVTRVEAERLAAMQRALAIFDRALGPAHPQTIDVRVAASLHVLDPVAAGGLLAPGCAALSRYAPEEYEGRARCLAYLAHHAAESGDESTSAALLLEVEGLLKLQGPRTMSDVDATLLRARVDLALRNHAPAIAQLRAALARPHEAGDWWQQRERAELNLLLGLHLRQLSQVDAATEALRAAVDGYVPIATGSRNTMLQQRLALARLTLATLPTDGSAEQRRESTALLDAADAWYREAGSGYEWRRRQLMIARPTHDPANGH